MKNYYVGTIEQFNGEDGIFCANDWYNTIEDANVAASARDDEWYIFHRDELQFLQEYGGSKMFRVKLDDGIEDDRLPRGVTGE